MTQALREKALKALATRGERLKARINALPEDAPNMNLIADLAEWAADCYVHSDYDHAKAKAEIDRLREALSKVQDAITAPVNSLAIVDTVWLPLERDPNTSIETLVDFIDAALTRSPQ